MPFKFIMSHTNENIRRIFKTKPSYHDHKAENEVWPHLWFSGVAKTILHSTVKEWNIFSWKRAVEISSVVPQWSWKDVSISISKTDFQSGSSGLVLRWFYIWCVIMFCYPCNCRWWCLCWCLILSCPFSQEMSWMRSGTDSSQIFYLHLVLDEIWDSIKSVLLPTFCLGWDLGLNRVGSPTYILSWMRSGTELSVLFYLHFALDEIWN